MQCRECDEPIPKERIDHFEEFGKKCNTCVRCSTEEKVTGVMIYTQKTGCELEVTDTLTNLYFYRARRRSTYNASLPLNTVLIGKTGPGKFTRVTVADQALKKG